MKSTLVLSKMGVDHSSICNSFPSQSSLTRHESLYGDTIEFRVVVTTSTVSYGRLLKTPSVPLNELINDALDANLELLFAVGK